MNDFVKKFVNFRRLDDDIGQNNHIRKIRSIYDAQCAEI